MRFGSRTSNPAPAPIKAIVRAHRWFDNLLSDCARSLVVIAEKEGISDRYVGQLLVLKIDDHLEVAVLIYRQHLLGEAVACAVGGERDTDAPAIAFHARLLHPAPKIG